MSDIYPILVILKPELLDPSIRRENMSVFVSDVVFPSPETILHNLFQGIITKYDGPFRTSWSEEQIRAQYNQPHHFFFEDGFQKNRVDTFVEIYTGRTIEIYRAYGDSSSPDLLNIRKKEIRNKLLRYPNVAFYNLFHISDSVEDAKRELEIYKKCIE